MALPIFSTMILLVFAATHFNNLTEHEYVLFAISLFFFFVAFFLFLFSFGPRILAKMGKCKKMAIRINNAILQLPFSLEDPMLLVIIGGFGFHLVARVVAGTCPENTTSYDSQQCNPTASTIPTESFIVLYAAPLLAIKILRTVSLVGLMVSWCLILGFLTFGIVYTEAWSQIWALVFSAFFMGLTVESERSLRLAFVHVMEIQEQKTAQIFHLRAKHEAKRSLAKV